MNDPKSPSTSIQVMSRMFALLDTLAQGQEAVSLKHISAQTGLHPSTAHRILNDLAAGRYVERAGPGSYRLGLRLLDLGNLVRARLDLREEATKPMQDLHRATGWPVSLYLRQGHEAVCLSKTVQERSGVQLHPSPHNQHMSLVHGVVGRAMLIKDSTAQVNHLCQLDNQRPESVALDIQQARTTGVLCGADEQTPGQQCTVSPIFNDAGLVLGAIALTGPTGPSSNDEVAQAVRDTAARISLMMGWSGVRNLSS